jgi:hypothetical protein
VVLTDTVAIGEDDNSGGGSQAGHDASVTYELDLTGTEAHPKQGVHITLTINADGSQGTDVKHKVFWVTGCEGPSPSESPTPTPSESPSPTPSPRAVGVPRADAVSDELLTSAHGQTVPFPGSPGKGTAPPATLTRL